jgi:phosphopantothenoylcysteine synthetase/decarboxylase
MSHSNIVICMTGSIAAYKACELVSSLKKLGHNVKVIMSQTATKFVGTASSAISLAGDPVFIDDFSEDSMMSHIELGRWCDAALVYPPAHRLSIALPWHVGMNCITLFSLAYDFASPFFLPRP